jgi:uncharacterized DUF497 family protein
VSYFAWNSEKNEILKSERGVSFEEAVLHIEQGDILEVLEHPNQQRYPGQRISVIEMAGYAYLIPFVESSSEIFLKTIIPSRKATGEYLRGREEDG